MFFLASCVYVVSIVSTWITVAELAHWVQHDKDIAYSNHFFLVFLSTSALVFVPLLYSLLHHLHKALVFIVPALDRGTRASEIPLDEGPPLASQASWFIRGICCKFPFEKYPRLVPLHLMALAFPLSVLWITASSIYYISLSLSDFTTITVLFQINAVFVFLFSWCFLQVEASMLKAGGLLLSIVGASLVFWARETAGDNRDTGVLTDFLIVLVALVWALYEVTFARLVGDVPFPVMLLFLGFIGAVCAVLFWPLFLVLHYTSFEPFEWPKSEFAWSAVLLLTLANATMHVAIGMGLVRRGPFFVSMASVLSIPAGAAYEYAVNGKHYTVIAIVGASLIFIAVVMSNVSTPKMFTQRKKAEQEAAKRFHAWRDMQRVMADTEAPLLPSPCASPRSEHGEAAHDDSRSGAAEHKQDLSGLHAGGGSAAAPNAGLRSPDTVTVVAVGNSYFTFQQLSL